MASSKQSPVVFTSLHTDSPIGQASSFRGLFQLMPTRFLKAQIAGKSGSKKGPLVLGFDGGNPKLKGSERILK